MTTEELEKLEATLWQTADTLRMASDLKPSEYSTPVLGIIFLKFADNKYAMFESEIEAEFEKLKGSRRERPIHKSAERLVLRPRQEQLLHLLRDHGGMAPGEIWKALGVSRQGAMDLLRPLIEAGLVEKIGGKKTGRYVLRNP